MVLTPSEKEGAPQKAIDQFVKARSVYQKLCSMAKPGRVVELWLSRSHFKKLAVSQLSSLLCVEQPCVPEAVQPVVRERTQVALMSTGVEELFLMHCHSWHMMNSASFQIIKHNRHLLLQAMAFIGPVRTGHRPVAIHCDICNIDSLCFHCYNCAGAYCGRCIFQHRNVLGTRARRGHAPTLAWHVPFTVAGV